MATLHYTTLKTTATQSTLTIPETLLKAFKDELDAHQRTATIEDYRQLAEQALAVDVAALSVGPEVPLDGDCWSEVRLEPPLRDQEDALNEFPRAVTTPDWLE